MFFVFINLFLYVLKRNFFDILVRKAINNWKIKPRNTNLKERKINGTLNY